MVIDTSAIVAILKGEPGHELLLAKLIRDPDPIMSMGTALELYLVSKGLGFLQEYVEGLLNSLRIRVIHSTDDQLKWAKVGADIAPA